MNRHSFFASTLALASTSVASAQFDPASGQWDKMDPTHVRVMTWNIEDALCSSNFKINAAGNWNATARIVADMAPDILVLQETGDNDGNGTGGGVDSTGTLANVVSLFFNGGADPYRGGQVGSYVRMFSQDPDYNLPHVFVATRSDGFNRNIILSRWPFTDLNGDGTALYNDIPSVSAPYTSGTGGIRGFQFAEIDLPDDLYGGDLVIGNAHLKSGGGSGNENQRVSAGKNVGYFIEHFYNGAGSGVVDPNGTVFDFPAATNVLNDLTPVIVAGDWNQDERANLSNPGNIKGPAAWITEGLNEGGADGSDRDSTDMTYDDAPRKIINFNGTVFDGSPLTNSAGKIDYIAYQDSIVDVANQFVFDTFELNGVYPPAVAGYVGQGFNASRDAADHWPVILDFVFPAPVVTACPANLNDDNDSVGADDLAVMLAAWGGSGEADLNADGTVDASDLAIMLAAWGPCE